LNLGSTTTIAEASSPVIMTGVNSGYTVGVGAANAILKWEKNKADSGRYPAIFGPQIEFSALKIFARLR